MSHKSPWGWSCSSLACWQKYVIDYPVDYWHLFVKSLKNNPKFIYCSRQRVLTEIFMWRAGISWTSQRFWMWAKPCLWIDLSVPQTLGTSRYKGDTVISIVCLKFNEERAPLCIPDTWCSKYQITARLCFQNTAKVQNVLGETINAERFLLILEDNLEADLIDLLLSTISPLGSRKLLIIRCITVKP